MTCNDIEPHSPPPDRTRDRIFDWLGAQGALLLTVYMCSGVTLVAFLFDIMG